MSTTDDRAIRVLLIEDDEDDFILTRDLLREIYRDRLRLDWEADPDAALEVVARRCHDVYLVDYRLGGRDGLQMLGEAVARGCVAPLILLTGLGGRAIDVEAMRVGAADFLTKGEITAALLERSIRYSLERKRTEEELRRSGAELESRVAERTEELRRRVEELDVARAAAEAASRAKDTFMAIVSHELRTPLTPALFAATALLDRGGLDPEARDLLAMVAENLAMEARLIDDLLDATRVVRGKMEYRFEAADAHDLIRWAVEHCGHFGGPGPGLRQELGAARPRVRGDVARLRQVLCNLLSNASKFTPEGGTVTIATRDEGGRVLISVRDTGVGITPEALPRIFDAFEQGEGTAIRRYGGLGLGLTISRAIVEAHGGRLEARSAGPGAGSEFTLDLEAGG